MPTQNIYDLVDTWNAAGTTFTAVKMNVTDTASAAGSLLMDLQVGGSSQFKVGKTGGLTLSGPIASSGTIYATSGQIGIFSASNYQSALRTNGVVVTSTNLFGFSFDNSAVSAADTILTRRAAANLRLGAADAAAPVAQTLSVQSVVAGTTNTAGANLTITGSQGTGTGAGGSIVFQVAPAGSSGTAQNALATALTIDGNRRLRTISSDGIGSQATKPVIGSGDDTGLYFSTGSWVGVQVDNQSMYAFSGGIIPHIVQPSRGGLSWSSGNYPGYSALSIDVSLFRDAANTLALRNGANAQVLRVYNTTDGTNGNWLELAGGAFSGVYPRIAGTGTNSGLIVAGSATGNSAPLYLRFQYNQNGWRLDTSANLLAETDNAYDIGASGANRPRHGYFGGNLVAGGSLGLQIGTGSAPIYWAGRSQVYSPANGNILLQNAAQSDFDRLQFGGTTSSFPALKRSSTTLQARLADDSAFASVQGKLTTDTAYQAGAPTATGYLVLYDSTGTAYRVPAVLN